MTAVLAILLALACGWPVRAKSDDVGTLLGLTADLSVTKTDNLTSVNPSQDLVYDIQVSNAGPSAVAGATLVDVVPDGLACAWSCSGTNGGTCTASGAGNINDSMNLPSGGIARYILQCHVSSLASGTLSNTAVVAVPVGVSDPTPGNNSATDITTIERLPANLSATKTVTGTFLPGSLVEYTILLHNAGPGVQLDIPGDEFTDVLPPGLELISYIDSGPGTAIALTQDNVLHVNASYMPAGETDTIRIVARISANASGVIVNQGTLHYDGKGSGINTSTALTDDPTTQAASDGTSFVVVGAVGPTAIPANGRWALLLLMVGVCAFAWKFPASLRS